MPTQQATTTAAFEATVQSFRLTPEEEAELETLKPRLDNVSRLHEELEYVASTTVNVGIQYLMLNHPKLVRFVANSDDLDPRAIPPFLDRVVHTRQVGSLYVAEIAAVNSLSHHKVVVSDVDLFKRTWDVARLLNPRLRSPLKEAESDFDYFFYALDWHSTSSKDNANAMSIETLLLILAHLYRQEQKHEIDQVLDTMRAKALKVRDDEIKTWIQENMPDYAGVPLAWVLRVYDLHQAV